MSSRGNKKTTMAKLTREARLRERRSEKLARKERRHAAAIAGEDPYGVRDPLAEQDPFAEQNDDSTDASASPDTDDDTPASPEA